MIEPLDFTFEVACPVEHAFTVWTTKISSWWPTEHTVSGDPGAEVFLEPRIGGRLYERAPSGEEHEWGEVTAWEPPGRLAYAWHIRRDRADATDVAITFTALDDTRTRVDIHHDGWERLGAAADRWRDRNVFGWTTTYPAFIAAAERVDE